MGAITAREARNKFRDVIDRVVAGEEVTVLRRGKPVVRIVPSPAASEPFPDLTEFRSSIQVHGRSLRASVSEQRQAARY